MIRRYTVVDLLAVGLGASLGTRFAERIAALVEQWKERVYHA